MRLSNSAVADTSNAPGILRGRVALVTGGSRGIGRAIAQRLAAAGATVVVTARSADKPASGTRFGSQRSVPGTLAETVALIEGAGGKAIALAADLEEPGDVGSLVETVLAMCHLPASERTGLVAFSMHFPWHHGLQVMSLDGRTALPRREPPAWSHPATSASGE